MPAAISPRQQARAYLRLIGLGAAIGIPAALVAAGFLGFVHYVEGWLWDDLPAELGYRNPPWFLVLLLPVAGAAIVVAARTLLPGDGGHDPREGLSSKPTPWRFAPGIALAAVGTLSFGAVLGPEAPVIALGSAVGMAAAGLARLPERSRAVLSSAGSFSAISALFGGPVVAGVLLVEGGLAAGTSLLPVLVPGLVSAAVGYLVFVGLGDWGGLEAQGLVVPNLPLYDGTHVLDLLVGVAVGLLAAVVVTGVRRFAARVAERETTFTMPGLLLSGGLAVGALAVTADLLGADSEEVLFSGQTSVPAIVAEDSAWIIAVVIAAKFLAYGVSLGCGFRGGPIFPAIFLGVALASFAVTWFDVSPTLAIAVGSAAGMAAQTRLLISPLFFSSLLVGSQGADAIPAAVLATTTAWVAVSMLERAAGARHAVAPDAAARG